MSEYAIWGIAVGSALLGSLVTGSYLIRKMRCIVAYMLDALEDHETNFRFDEHKICFRHYYRTLNRIRALFEREKEEVADREHFYSRILERVRTGVVVVDLSERRLGRVLYCNSMAYYLLGVATLSHVRQLKMVSEELERSFFDLSSGHEQRCSFYNERGKITISLMSVETQLQEKSVKIVMFNDVTTEMAHNEDMSWNKLIRVLTHEIMNTVTPISSLSHVLAQGIAEKEDGMVDIQELKQGLDTIYKSSEGLIKFVNNYRILTRVAPPQKSAFFFRELITQVKNLTSSQITLAQAGLFYIEKSEDILLYADPGQISQILVNLVKNALQAGASIIKIIAEIDFAEAVVVRIYNNGHHIDIHNQEEIFIPFYTTKSEGTGIGLSLSRQIMRLHNGSLELERSDENGTIFKMVFK